jgi:hypothetical protein
VFSHQYTAAFYITSSILTGYFKLPNGFFHKTSDITFVNPNLAGFGKEYFRRNTYAALLQGTAKQILFTLNYNILIPE